MPDTSTSLAHPVFQPDPASLHEKATNPGDAGANERIETARKSGKGYVRIMFDAVEQGDKPIVRAMLRRPKDFPIDTQDEAGRTVLHVAVLSPNGRPLGRDILQGSRIDTTLRDNDGQSAYQVARDRKFTSAENYLRPHMEGEVRSVLRVGDWSRDFDIPRLYRLLAAGVDFKLIKNLNQPDRSGLTLLHHAVADRNLAMMKKLVEDKKVDILVRDPIFGSPYLFAKHLAKRYPHDRKLAEAARYLQDTMQRVIANAFLDRNEDRIVGLIKAGTLATASITDDSHDGIIRAFSGTVPILAYGVHERMGKAVGAILEAIPDKQQRADYVNKRFGDMGQTAMHIAAGVAIRLPHYDSSFYDTLRAAGGDENIEDKFGGTPREIRDYKAPGRQ